MLSRRQLLLGVGAMAAGACNRHTTAAGLPPRSPETAFKGTLESDSMHRSVRWRMTRPVSGDPTGLVVCLHGKGNDENFAMDTIRVPDFVASVGAQLWVASVDGGEDSYWHRRRSGIDPEAMVVNELVPTLLERIGRPVKIGLLGWSMGGYGALLLAGRHPTLFRAVAAASPALWPTAGATAPGAFDSKADFDANNIFDLAPTLQHMPVRIDCGSSDPFVAMARRALTTFHAAGAVTPGAHTADYWRSVAPDQIRFLAPFLAN